MKLGEAMAELEAQGTEQNRRINRGMARAKANLA